MARGDDWCPLPELHEYSVLEMPTFGLIPKAPGTNSLDALWERFVSSPLVTNSEQKCCHCKRPTKNETRGKKPVLPQKAAVAFKSLYDPGLSLSQALATSRPQFIKESQLRVFSVNRSDNRENRRVRVIKTRKRQQSQISDEEREKRKKLQAAENRLRVKRFQKEVLDQLHSQ